MSTMGTVEVPDAARWPDLARVPQTRARAAIAGALLRRVAARLPLRIDLPDGGSLGRPGDVPSMRVHKPTAFLRRVGVGGLIGFGESYQAGEWDSDDLPRLLGVFANHVSRWCRATCNGCAGSTAPGTRAPNATLWTVPGATSIATTTCPTSCSGPFWTSP